MPARAYVESRFSMRMRELLAENGVSYRALAGRTFYCKSYLHDLAVGRRAPTREAAQAVDDALDAGGSLVEIVAGVFTLMARVWDEHDNARLAEWLLAKDHRPEDALRIAHEWLVAEPPQVAELRAGRRIGSATVARVEQRVQQLRLLDDHVGSGHTYAILGGELAATAALLRKAAYRETVGRRLLVAVADLCQLAGFVAADAGRHDEAKRLHLAGVHAGHAADNAEVAANNLSSLAYLEANVGDRRRAVMLARSAYAGVRYSGRATVRALVLERLAWTNARAGEAEEAARTLGRVEEVYPEPRPADDPSWTYWLTADEVEIMAGRVWTELRRPALAIPILKRATARYGDDVPREAALYLTWLVEALIQDGDISTAAEYATKARRYEREAQSPRVAQRVAAVREMLAPHRNVREVARFEEEYRTGAT